MSYYTDDHNLGDTVYFSGTDVYSQCNADLIGYTPAKGTVKSNYRITTGKSSYKKLFEDIDGKKMDFQFFVGGSSYEDAEKNVSNLISRAKETVITTSRSTFEYPAILLDYKDEATGVDYYHKVTLTFLVTKRLPLVTKNYSSAGEQTFTNDGNTASGVTLAMTFASSAASVSLTVNGLQITIENIASGSTITIDGMNGMVYDNNSISRVDDTNIWKFPKVIPGSNSVTLPACSCVLTYYPTFE